jgi:hypothetical protein
MSHRMLSTSCFAFARPLILRFGSLVISLVLCSLTFGGPPVASPSQFLDETVRTPAATTAAIGMAMSVGGQPAFACMMLNPRLRTVWMPEEDNTQAVTEAPGGKAPILLLERLEAVKDGKGFPSAWSDPQADLENQAYSYVLYVASKTSLPAFAKSAKDNNGLTYVHLFNEPSKYRGEVVHVEGRLKRLLKIDSPADARQAGVENLYEGWMFSDLYGANPTCLLFTELPPGVKPGETVEYRIAFDGYFFKRYRYKAADNYKANEFRDAPLLIGKSFVLTEPIAVAAEAGWAESLVPVFVALLGGTLALIAGTTWWFRRSDKQVRSRLEGARAVTFVEPTEQP